MKMKTPYQTIIYEKNEGIAIITLNRPKSMNALNTLLLKELYHVVGDIDNDEDIKVAILTGSEKFFVAGADITEIDKIANPVSARRFLKIVQDVINRVEDMEKPIIAAVSGFALGGGCELALACDIRLAAENAVFGLPEIKIGVIPGGGGTQRLPRLVGAGRAKELIYTGDFIEVHEAYRIGLVNKIYTTASLMEEAKKMASKIVRQPGEAVKAAKLSVNGGMNMDVKSAITYEARCFEILFSTEDQKEGTRAFLEKRNPVFKNR